MRLGARENMSEHMRTCENTSEQPASDSQGPDLCASWELSSLRVNNIVSERREAGREEGVEKKEERRQGVETPRLVITMNSNAQHVVPGFRYAGDLPSMDKAQSIPSPTQTNNAKLASQHSAAASRLGHQASHRLWRRGTNTTE